MFLEKIILGTVQLGIDYGINNSKGKPSLKESYDILEKAEQLNIQTLDTAMVYGDSEEVIGSFITKNGYNPFRIITKVKISTNANIERLVKESLHKLAQENIHILLYHSYPDMVNNPSSLNALKKLKDEGQINKIGVSVYNNNEIEELLEVEDIEVIQLPFNMLDNDNYHGTILKRAKEKGKTMHIRSVFLQGLFFKGINNIPVSLKSLIPQLSYIKTLAEEYHLSIQQMALGYSMSKEYIDGVLIGIESVDQLEENIISLKKQLPDKLLKEIDAITVDNPYLLNHSTWF